MHRQPMEWAHCLPSALKQRHLHYFTPGDVTCECGRFPSEMGVRMGLVEHPEREPVFDPMAIIQAEWDRRETARKAAAITVLVLSLLWPLSASAQPSVQAFPATLTPGASLSVTVQGGPGHIYDWITLAPVGSSDTTYTDVWFLSGTGLPPAAGVTHASFPITAPMTTGLYEVRFLASGKYGRLATSSPIAISGEPQPPAPNPTRIVFHGDSNSALSYTPSPANWTAIAGTSLGYSDLQNLSLPGAYAQAVRNDLQPILNLQPDRVVIMVGTNDMAHAIEAGIPHAAQLADYLRTMQGIIDTLRQAQVRTVILSPIFTLSALETARYPDWIAALKTLCLMSGVTFIDVWGHMAQLAETQPRAQFESYYRTPSVDPWHLSDAGHAMIAAFVVSALHP